MAPFELRRSSLLLDADELFNRKVDNERHFPCSISSPSPRIDNERHFPCSISSSSPRSETAIEEKEQEQYSPWKSLWLCNLIQMDSSISLGFFGWVVASYSVGQAISSPLFGLWSQRTQSTRLPIISGLLLTAVGNVLYALLPTLDHRNVRWLMALSRFLVGLGSGMAYSNCIYMTIGTLGVLRAYVATASIPQERSKAVSLAIASFVVGLAIGPPIQALFGPLKASGVVLGSLTVNMYTAPAWLMIAISLVASVLLITMFKESYAGIISLERKDPFFVLPKFDLVPAIVCMYLWFLQQGISTNIEVMSAPMTISMYNWNDSDTLLYNGIIQGISATISVSCYLLIAYTRIGTFDKRKLIFFGVGNFVIYHLINLPWPFYGGPLDYIKYAPNSTEESTAYSGGCYRRFTWCEHTRRIPLPLYVLSNTITFGLAFPFNASPLGTIYSQVLGPRQQGIMQGMFAFAGSSARFIAPLFSTTVFEYYGYLWIMITHIVLLGIGISSVAIFYKRLVPLRIIPPVGRPVRYKLGIFYKM